MHAAGPLSGLGGTGKTRLALAAAVLEVLCAIAALSLPQAVAEALEGFEAGRVQWAQYPW